MTKYIFVSGGVLSGLGKGVTAASLGVTLKARGYRVTNIKCENYLNLDSGNINPTEHGDVFLCEDGTEADLDLGTYERFLGQEVGRKNYTTMGQIYQTVIEATSQLKYRGLTVDAIPHVPEEVVRRIKEAAQGYDLILIELGGCAGEYQNIIYYEANRILKLQEPNNVIHIHVTYFPYPQHINELKTKPTQLSVKQLNSMGIQPDFIVGRAEVNLDDKRKAKVAYYCNLSEDDIISNPDCKSIYELPLIFEQQNFASRLLTKLNLSDKKPDLTAWQNLVTQIAQPKKQSLSIALIVKYLTSGACELRDSYASLLEALEHASTYLNVKLDLRFVKAVALEKEQKQSLQTLTEVDGIIVPLGWGKRGVEGKIKAIQYAREHKIPFLGLGYGMQLAVVEFARHVLNLPQAHTTEVDPQTSNPVIIPVDTNNTHLKNGMRLGAHDIQLQASSQITQIYQQKKAWKNQSQNLISERHRHRFMINPDYQTQLEAHGLNVTGTAVATPIIEFMELKPALHPFFIMTQAHPEYKSRPLQPHPLFIALLEAILAQKKSHSST